jgi:hypothetical protein
MRRLPPRSPVKSPARASVDAASCRVLSQFPPAQITASDPFFICRIASMVTACESSQSGRPRKSPFPIGPSLICFLTVVLLDVVVDGDYFFSLLVCPIWFLANVVWTASRRPNIRVATVCVLIPVATWLLVAANYSLQGRIAMANASRIIQACDEYRQTNGAYPERLSDLVPSYLSSIPRAKYCLSISWFLYFGPTHPILSWCQFTMFGRRVYSFDTRKWRYLD